jgi:hypothetical protein
MILPSKHLLTQQVSFYVHFFHKNIKIIYENRMIIMGPKVCTPELHLSLVDY